jgi:penicillin-binding protein 2
MNYSIGQGFLLVTPLQVLQSVNTIAWDGEQCRPHLLMASADQHGIKRLPAAQMRQVEIDKEILAVVRAGMRKAVVDGTCRSLASSAPGVCAKTGTAETRKGMPDHSWLVAYYPIDNPRYSLVCFFEYGGKSGEAAVPAANQLLRYLHENDPLGRISDKQVRESPVHSKLVN